MRRDRMFAVAPLLCCFGLIVAAQLPAQVRDDVDAIGVDGLPFQPIDALQGLSSLGPGVEDQITISSSFTVDASGRRGQLAVSAELSPGWHTYSITQRPGGPQRTEIQVDASDRFRVSGPFQPNQAPEVRQVEFFPVPVEEHHDRVTWSAPIELVDGVDPRDLKISGRVLSQVCQENGVCVQREADFVSQFAGAISRLPATSGTEGGDDDSASAVAADTTTGANESGARPDDFRLPGSHAVVRGQVSPQAAVAGGQLSIALTVVSDPGWYVYAIPSKGKEPVFNNPTVVGLTLPDGWSATAPIPSSPPKEKETGLKADPIVRYHEGEVTWKILVSIPSGVTPGTHDLVGLLGLHTCTDQTCDPRPSAALFTARVTVADREQPGQTDLGFEAASYADAKDLRAKTPFEPAQSEMAASGLDLDLIDPEDFARASSFPIVLLAAFGAGLILNFMPCVLPVIGLKIMAFVHQAGESRRHVFVLNLWYCLGLISVFLVLATLAVFFQLGWGAHFASETFNIVLSAVVFVFALSFLGIWEIPIPGFVGSSQVNDLANQEGPSGAFFKGVLTTVLATPCSGPLLGPAMAFFVSQPPVVAYAGFASAGLGMASPYLLIGVFPQLVSFLPKPGPWMDTFKHVMGFVLLGTVVFLLTFLEMQYVVPAVAFMIGLWAAFWWIGRVSLTEPAGKKIRAWLGGGVFATLIGLFAFGWLVDVMEARFQRTLDREISALVAQYEENMEARFQRTVDRDIPGTLDREIVARVAQYEQNMANPAVQPKEAGGDELPWQPYSYALLEKLTAEQRTVLVDFTADW